MSQSNNVEDLLQERERTHGRFELQGARAQMLKAVARDSPDWDRLRPEQKEAIEMILTKVSRIVSGNPFASDHWQDIRGYAELGDRGN